MLRLLTIFFAFIGFVLCVGAAVTGVYWGMILKGADPTWKTIHLGLAIACVFVSMPAHALSIHMLRKKA
ncbi:MAG: hypothetical protein ACAI25_01070 [Planctomycetota bacterium]